MKYVRQFLIIILFSFIGEGLRYVIPLPVPSSIYGLVLLFLALEFKIIPLDAVKETGKFLIEIMPLMFIPAAVGLISSWKLLSPILIPVIVITCISTICVMAVAGRCTQYIIRKQNRHPRHKACRKPDERNK